MKQLLKNAKIVSIFIFVISFLGCTDVESVFPTVTSGFTYTVNEDTGTVTFINISEEARTYAWDFGDGSSSTEINPIKTYAATGTYTVTLIATNGAGASDSSEDNVSVTITEVPTGGGGDPTVATSLPIDFESNETLSGVFEEGDGVTGVPIANPDQSSINTSDTVYEFTKATDAAWYSGMFNVFESDFDPAEGTTFKAKIWSPKANINVRMALEKEGNQGPIVTYNLDQTVTEANTWVELTFDFSGTALNLADGYDKIVIFPDYDATNETAGDGSVYYIDDIEQGAGTGGGGCTDTMLELPIDFDCSSITYDFVTFNGASYSVIDNPQLSGINDVASKVGEIVNIGGAFEGGAFTLDTPVDFAIDKAISMKFYSTVAVPVLVKFEGAGAPIETTANHGGTGWEQLTFTFTSSEQFGTLVLFVDGPGATAGTFYMDDIEQVAAPAGGGCTDTMLELPIDFDCSSIIYDFVTFNGASYSVIDNPQLSGINNVASKVGEIVNIGGAFEGGAFTLDTPVDFATDKAITMKLYSTVAVPVLLKFEGAGAPIETTADHGGTGWEQLTFTFTSSDQFTTLVLFIDGPGTTAGTFYMDDIEQVAAPAGGGCTDTMLELPIDFDCSSITYDFVTFNGASYNVVDNPQLSGINAVASKVGEIVNIGGAFEGGAFTLDTPVDFATDKNITMKFYSTTAVPILLKFEGAGAPVETIANHGGTGWEQLTFTFTTSDQFGTLVLFVDGPGATAGTFYMDDIEQVAGTGGGGATGGELAANGDFETGDDTGWLLFQNGGTSALDNTINNGGSWSGNLATGGPSNPAFKQERIGAGTVNAGDTVQIQFDHIGSVVQPGAVFNVILFGEGTAGASFTNVFNPAPTLTGSWTTFTGTFTIPGGTDVSEGISFLIEAVCGGDAGCSVTANIDNVSVTVL